MRLTICALLCGAATCGLATPALPQAPVEASRFVPSTVLPRPVAHAAARIGQTVETSAPAQYPAPLVAPKGAPNILLVMTDDVGFGASSTFGGPVATATFDALAARGERYNRFNTTALCAPTRASLLTGRNPHSVGFGTISEMGTGYPGYTTILPQSAATIGEVLRQNGYVTSWFGKNHNTPEWELSAAGPFDRWPNGLGFDYFYGFMGGATSQWNPSLFENHMPVSHPDQPGYILDRDLADHAIGWLRSQNQAAPDKPFLLYYAPGTSHSPHHAPAEWIARFKGQFDQGWDRMREETLARQIKLGVVPAGTHLTPRPDSIPAWDTLSAEQQHLYAHMMEVYAAALSYADAQVGRVLDEIRSQGKLDNTLVIYIQGDNGASGEGGPTGSINDIAAINGLRADLPTMLKAAPELGGPKHYNNYPVGWAWAMNAPFQWTKQVASHLGGIRNGMVISWPRRMSQPGGLRQQFAHVADIAPTIYEAAGIPAPTRVNGVAQQPIDGISLAYSFNAPAAPSRRRSQIFEMQGNAAIYADGWMASTTPTRAPWVFAGPGGLPTQGHWQLYDLAHDFSQSQDLAGRYPARLSQLEARFWKEARAGQILPIDNRSFARWDSRNRPSLLGNRTHFRYFPSDTRITGGAFPDLAGRDWVVTARIDVPQGAPANGTLVANGSQAAGWGLFLIDGRPQLVYKASDAAADMTRLSAPTALAPGAHDIRIALRRTGEALAAQATLSVDGQAVAETAIRHILPVYLPANAMIGWSFEQMTDDITPPFRFAGRIDWVDVDLTK
ncbi:MAG TPA: arylsulfatase [Novosphingobium sp.]|nr:arylsulfatase [Novosphingobium sp.]